MQMRRCRWKKHLLWVAHACLPDMGNTPEQLGGEAALSRALIPAIGLVQICALISSIGQGCDPT